MIASTVMAAGVVLLGIGIAPGVASAHTPSVSDDCGGLAVSFTSYEGNSTNNRVTVTIDGASQGFNFASSYSNTFPWSSAVNHTWSVSVDANRNSGSPTQYDWSASGTQVACNPTTSTSTSTTTSTTSTTTSTTTTTTTQPPCVDCTPNTNVTIPPTTTTEPGATTSTEPGATTTTVEQMNPTTTTTAVGQSGPTSTVDQSSGAATTTTNPIGGTLPATGNDGRTLTFTVIALTLIGIGAVMLRLASRPTR